GSFYLKYKNIEIFEEDGQWKYKPIAEDDKEYKRDCFMGIMGFIPCFIKWVWFDKTSCTDLFMGYYNDKFERYKRLRNRDYDDWCKDWEQVEQRFLIEHIESEKEYAELTIDTLKRYFGDDCVLDFYRATNRDINEYFGQYIKFLESKIKEQPKQEQHQIPDKLNIPNIKRYFDRAIEAGLMTPDFEWLQPKIYLAFFAGEISDKEKLNRSIDVQGNPMREWRSFEGLFTIKGDLATGLGKAYQNYLTTKNPNQELIIVIKKVLDFNVKL
ncbi:MAG: hypothetical protein J6Q51_02935, partial [Clostridia bacterium]|nr:hypothetical protein [Clostridia bacterium]